MSAILSKISKHLKNPEQWYLYSDRVIHKAVSGGATLSISDVGDVWIIANGYRADMGSHVAAAMFYNSYIAYNKAKRLAELEVKQLAAAEKYL